MNLNFFLYLNLLICLCFSCDQLNEEEQAEESTNFSLQATSTPKTKPSLNTVTPGSLRISTTSLALAEQSPSDICIQLHESGTDDYNACKAVHEIRQRFFSGEGPTDLDTSLGRVDSRLGEMISRSSSGYIPCLDTQNSAGGSLFETEYQAYNMLTFDTNYTFADGSSFDAGFTYNLSCWTEWNDQNGKNAVGVGRKNDTWYLKEANSDYGLVASLDKNNNLEVWFSMGTGISTDITAETETTDDYPNSTGIAHILAEPEKNLLQLSVYGYGVIEACKTRFIMNDVAGYLEINQNYFGACFDGDVGFNNAIAERNSALDNKKYCFKMNGSLPEYVEGLDLCEANGLNADAFTIDALGRDVIQIYNATTMFSEIEGETIEQIPTYEVLYFPPSVNVEVEGYETNTVFFESSDELDATVSASCSAIPSESKTFTKTFTFNPENLLDMVGGPDDTAEKVLEKLNQSLTADTSPYLYFTISRAIGVNWWADFNTSVIFKIDGIEVASSTIASPELETESKSTLELPLTITSSITNATTFEVIISGSNQLACSSATGSTIRNASLNLGFPQLKYYVTPEVSSEGQNLQLK